MVLLFSYKLNAQNYYFNGKMSKEILDNYLDRTVDMSSLSDIEGPFVNEQNRVADIQIAKNLKAKFISNVVGWWENGWGQTKFDQLLNKSYQNVTELKNNDPEVICQAFIAEYTSPTIETFYIPDYVWNEFGQPIPYNNRLSYNAMLYPMPANQWQPYGRDMSEDERKWMINISSVHSQMWYYFLAT